jgi:uncharacterized protein involved in outer membrane biogenesis
VVSKIPWHSLGRFALIVVCLILVLAVVIVVLPIYLDVSAFRGPIQQALSGVAEAPVTIGGEIRLHPSPWPTLRISELEIAARDGDPVAPFARIDRAEIRISVIALLRNQLRLQRFLLSGAVFHARRPEGRGGNWPVWQESDVAIRELAGIEIEDVTLLLDDHQTVRTSLVVDRLTCDIAEDRPLDLKLRGTLEGLPLVIAGGGPTLAAPLSQASDFPLSLSLQLSDLQLNIEGSASREPTGTRFQFAFGASSDNLDFLRQLASTKIPRIGGFELSGELSNRNAALEATKLEGSIGSTSLFGRLALDLSDEIPELSGRLSLGELDLEPWLGSEKSTTESADVQLPITLLNRANANLKVTLKEITGPETKLEDLAAEIEIENARMRVPATLQVAGIPLSTEIEVQAEADPPSITARTATQDLSLHQLGQLFELPNGLEGHFDAVTLDLVSSGSTLETLEAALQIDVSADGVALAIMDEAGQDPVEIYFDEVRLTHQPRSPLTATAQGKLLEESFSIELETATLPDLLARESWPLQARVRGAGATLDLAGNLDLGAAGLDFDLDLSLAGDRLGDLGSWLGFPGESPLAYALQGHLSSTAGARSLKLEDSSVGNSQFSGELAWNTDDDDEPFRIDLHATTLDLGELRDPSASITDLDTQEDVIGIDIPILPNKTRFHDAEIELTVDRLLRKPVDLTAIEASLHILEGRLEPSPFSFAYDTQRFTGQVSLDLREEIPDFTLALQGSGEKLGGMLHREGFVEDFEVAAQKLDLRIDAAGATVREIIQSADLSARLVDVRWQVQPPELEGPVQIELEQVDLVGPKGQPIELTARGFVDEEPLTLRLVFREPAGGGEVRSHPLPFALTLGLAATEIDLDGEVQLPISRGEFAMNLDMHGASLATLANLVEIDLPDLGPYQLQGHLTLDSERIALEDLDLVLGESDLQGEVGYRRRAGRPTFTADLTSQLLRTQDILDITPSAESAADNAEVEERLEVPSSPGLTLERFNGFDAAIDLTAHRIITAGGEIDDLVIDVDLERGSLDVEMRRPQPESRDAELTARIRPSGPAIEAAVEASWDRQPYGLLADLLNPDSAGGEWGVDLDLTTRGASSDEWASNLSGHLYFADYPADLDATIFDLWGGGLVNSLLPVVQIGAESRVNCTVARFRVENGVLTPEPLIIDSTRSRVDGKGSIDLPGNSIELKLKPRPKQRNLINLATPITVSGPLKNPEVKISRGGLAVTFFRLSLWVYTVWRDIARQPLPADGSDVCLDPFATSKQRPADAVEQ